MLPTQKRLEPGYIKVHHDDNLVDRIKIIRQHKRFLRCRQVQGVDISVSGFLNAMIGWRFSSEVDNRSGKREEKALLTMVPVNVRVLEIVSCQRRLNLSLSI